MADAVGDAVAGTDWVPNHLALSKIGHVAKAALLRRRLRREHGVRGTSIMGLIFGCSDLNVVYTSRHFQPCAESFDDRFLFIGPSIDLRSATVSTPWEEASQADLIYISLGTLFNAESNVLPDVLRGVPGTECPRHHVHRNHRY